MLFASACSFQLQMVTPPPAVSATPINIQPSVTSPTSTVIPSPTAVIVNPTDVLIMTKSAAGTVPTLTPQNLGTTPIRFAPNGTYVDLVDSITLGSSKTYSIAALKGQIMSVSIHQGPTENWTVIPIKIVGADGTALCPLKANDACYFWRGVLPATQTYFVTLSPQITVSNFTLRVAIDPPGTTTQAFTYSSKDVSLQYSDEFAPFRLDQEPAAKIPPEFALKFIDSSYYVNTNLIEAYFAYGVTTDSTIVASCTEPLAMGGPETIIDHVTLNGVDFVHSEGVGVGAGNLYDSIYYRTLYNNACYEATLFIHSGNIGAYSPDSGVKEFDRTTLLQKFQNILSTLIIK